MNRDILKEILRALGIGNIKLPRLKHGQLVQALLDSGALKQTTGK